jgi:hypothetical protein
MVARYLDFIIVFPHWRHRIRVFFEVFLHWFLSRRFLWKVFSLRFQGMMVTSLEKCCLQILVFLKEVLKKVKTGPSFNLILTLNISRYH